jgi:hypothetical protein
MRSYMIKENKISENLPFSYSNRPVQRAEFQTSQRRTKKQTNEFCLRGRRKDNCYWVCGTELARLYPNFKCVLAFEMTLRSYLGQKHRTVNSEVSRHDGWFAWTNSFKTRRDVYVKKKVNSFLQRTLPVNVVASFFVAANWCTHADTHSHTCFILGLLLPLAVSYVFINSD